MTAVRRVLRDLGDPPLPSVAEALALLLLVVVALAFLVGWPR